MPPTKIILHENLPHKIFSTRKFRDLRYITFTHNLPALSSATTTHVPNATPSTATPPSSSSSLINSVVFNLSGKLLLLPREQPSHHASKMRRHVTKPQVQCGGGLLSQHKLAMYSGTTPKTRKGRIIYNPVSGKIQAYTLRLRILTLCINIHPNRLLLIKSIVLNDVCTCSSKINVDSI